MNSEVLFCFIFLKCKWPPKVFPFLLNQLLMAYNWSIYVLSINIFVLTLRKKKKKTMVSRALEWGDGYYNGDIKTRKTVQAMELTPDKIGLQRSKQLRELYESLLEGETKLAYERPSAALSPEDLTDAEWYYLVCMSFVFNSGQGYHSLLLIKT